MLWTGGCASGARPYTETYVVRPQDTLYSIAWRHDLDFRDLAKWNNIGSDYRVAIGQVLTLHPPSRSAASSNPPPPTAAVIPPAKTSPAAAAPRAAEGARVGTPTPLPDATTRTLPSSTSAIGSAAKPPAPGAAGHEPEPAALAPPMVLGNSKWVWPTDRLSAPRPVPGGGILLFGTLGQDVRAAGTGRVVYTGSGIRGYGNLVIIKHRDNLLSSYAHNRELLVHEGQEVLAGQVIAHMGMGPHQVSALYFEIRVNGKPIDPLRYLTQ